jgi:predicted outer membrane repeat protein
MKKITFFTSFLTLLLACSLYSQETVWVAAPSDRLTKDGLSEATAYDSFARALLDINSAGDVLRVVGTVAAGSQNLSLTSTTPGGESINKNFQYTIEGDLGGSTLTGTNGLTRMFTINAASAGQDVTFKNITFTGATNSIGAGGGVFFTNQPSVNVTFENCRFEGNSLASSVTQGGGALRLEVSTVTITDCLFKENQALQNGGAISIIAGANVTMARCTFYKNKATTTTQSVGAAALYVNTATTVVTIDHCTFFQNNIGHPNQDYGTIRSDHGNTTITNSLFYDNKVTNIDGTPGAGADWGSSPNGIQSFSNSIAQYIGSNIDFRTNFISFVKGGLDPLAAANLTSSNLRFDATLGKVIYDSVAAGTNSPIDFDSDGNDIGAWESGLTLGSLSLKDNEFAANFSVSYHATTKKLKVLRSNDDSVSLEIYNLMGSKVISLKNASKEENINASSLQSGVYILVVKGSGSKSFAKKFVIN